MQVKLSRKFENLITLKIIKVIHQQLTVDHESGLNRIDIRDIFHDSKSVHDKILLQVQLNDRPTNDCQN